MLIYRQPLPHTKQTSNISASLSANNKLILSWHGSSLVKKQQAVVISTNMGIPTNLSRFLQPVWSINMRASKRLLKNQSRSSGQGRLRKVQAATLLISIAPASWALNTGTDLDLSTLPIAGGMAGAAFTAPQEVSAALFGNPATLAGFKGYNFEVAAGLLEPNVVSTQTSHGYSNQSISQARNYVIPNFAVSGEVSDNITLAGGVTVDSGLGANYRTAPITAGAGLGLGGAGVGGAATLPLTDEFISFSGNFGAGWAVTPDLHLGANVGLGFGLAQLGTVGNTTGLQGLSGNFGGTTASTHSIGVRGSVGATYAVNPEWTLSTSVKSPLSYNYHSILSTSINGYNQYQNAQVDQPLEVQWGFSNTSIKNLLLEADVLWKNWSNANLYKDVWQDQFLAILGGQYRLDNWSFRAGYSYATPILQSSPNGTISGFKGIGTLPFNTQVPGVLNSNDLVRVVQTTLAPVIWQNTLTGGLGYNFTQNFRLDGYGAVGIPQNASQNALALGRYSVNAGEWSIGLGANFKF